MLVPGLVYFAGMKMHQAIATSLAVIVPIAFSGAVKHYNSGNVNVSLALTVTVGGVLGSLLGVYLANIVQPLVLRKIFGIVLLLIGLNILFDFTKKVKPKSVKADNIEALSMHD